MQIRLQLQIREIELPNWREKYNKKAQNNEAWESSFQKLGAEPESYFLERKSWNRNWNFYFGQAINGCHLNWLQDRRLLILMKQNDMIWDDTGVVVVDFNSAE